MPKRQPRPAEPVSPQRLVLQNLTQLRERKAALRDEIGEIMRAGCVVVTRCRFNCPPLVKQPKTGKLEPCEHTKLTTARGLSVEERARVAACQQEIAGIDATLRAFSP